MKSWIKKMKRLFSGNSSNKDIEAHCSYTMSDRRVQLTRHRNTSRVSMKAKKRDYDLPTYGTAEGWIKQNRYLLEQTLDMIELYPELVKQPACSKLVDLITNVGIKTNGIYQNRSNTSTDESFVSERYGTEDSEQGEKNIPVPEILVSHAQEDEQLCRSRSPTVFVCGNLDDNNWHRLLVGLCRVYNVHCFSSHRSCFNQSIHLSDILLFLMDASSVNDHRYTEQLRSAVTKGIDIVYVRDMSFEFQESEEFTERLSSKTPYVSQTVRSQIPTNSLTDFKFGQNQSRRYSLDTFSIESDDSTNHAYTVPKICTLNTEHMDTLSASTLNKRPSTPRQSFDIAKILRLEYGTAHGYHQIYHEQCLERIVTTIDSKVHVLSRAHSSSAFSSASISSPSMRVSMYSSVSNDSAIDDMYQSLSPEPSLSGPNANKIDDKRGADDIYLPNDQSHTLADTVFLVSDEAMNSKPVMFRWPADADECKSIISSPSIDSFGFQDVDLSKRVNQLDLFGSNISD